MLIVTNLNLFVSSFQNLFDHSIVKVQDVNTSDVYENQDITSILANAGQDSAEIQALLKKYQSGREASKTITTTEESLLRSKLRDYPFAFNTLPPVNKIVIPSL
jgi:ribonuclease D